MQEIKGNQAVQGGQGCDETSGFASSDGASAAKPKEHALTVTLGSPMPSTYERGVLASTHTRGPWKCVECEFGDYQTGKVAFVVSSTVEPMVASVMNTRLIAAAPELHAALWAIVDACDDPRGSESGESLACAMVRLLPAARAALAAATEVEA
jgi:hypothetical protein